MRTPAIYYIASILILVLSTENWANNPADSLSFTRDIRPIISTNCLQCHGPSEKDREADLRLDREDGIAKAFRGSGKAVADLEGIARILSKDEDFQMPPKRSHRELKPADILKLQSWAEAGAPFESHWAFEHPVKPPLPQPLATTWVNNPIDHFVLNQLKAIGLQPNPQADRERLIRRVTYDLTGLPPTIQEIDDFLNDKSKTAYETVVDRLLRSKSFGERMALPWMDAARYGDTSVFHADGPRDMWAWRDWVIESYNNNLPFDQFTIKQIAGDLIPDATWRDKVASGFNRNHGTTDEGGAIAEEYRVEYVVDRVKTTSTIWLGLTMECAQCHSHKYDPISQTEYYQFFAYFNQTTDPGMQTRNGNQKPILAVPNEANQPLAEKAKSEGEQLKKQLAEHIKKINEPFQIWMVAAAKDADQSPEPKDMSFHLKMDETKGNRVTNSVDPSKTGVIKGKSSFKAGKIGNGIDLNGSTHVNFGEINGFDVNDPFTLSAWLYWDKKDGAIFSKMNNGGNYRGYDTLISGGHLEFHLVSTWPTDALKIRTESRLKEKSWQHVCVTYDGSAKAGGVRVFFDGIPQKWKVEKDQLKSTTITNAPFLIGQRNNGTPLKGMLDELRVYPRTVSELEVKVLAGLTGINELLAIPSAERTPQQVESLRQHYLSAVDKQYQQFKKKIATAEKTVADLAKPLTTVMVMQEMEKPRMTYVLDRGHYASPKKDNVIKPGTPAFLPTQKEELPSNRLGLAKWIVDRENPLTARVTINRYWQMLFGRGLVETSEDFGTQGSTPTHPKVLDWLAVEFMESGWNIKRTLKLIVMSATYRQSSMASPQKLAKDPENKLFSRGARFRLMGEFLRDGALSSAGLLNTKVGGPSVKPYQPPGLWNEVSLNGGLRFKRDAGENLYRKSMYTYWRRSAPMPSMAIFGTPSRDKCVVRRAKTNTPLQALVTLNDEQFVEAARCLAERVLKQKKTVREQIILAHRLVAGTTPGKKTIDLLEKTFREEQLFFKKHSTEASDLLATGERKRDEALEIATHAAMTIVSGILLNLDEALSRG